MHKPLNELLTHYKCVVGLKMICYVYYMILDRQSLIKQTSLSYI
jgi:hypothetical protein